MEFKLDLQALENVSFEEVETIDMEGTLGATEGAASVGSAMPIFPYFWFTCSA
ncbi:hypothetical protein [Paenibacillus popilliae]|uniref:Uncharacterized protein n=1 Tax=Paenibacillus popilliae ATCC 14706 TaxID=1212764 RepID=M9LKS3_PAEPP|nr:hypothetical protein [Paenibacillus popilliae]GAC40676.1 hypothetical protein PPOP_0003 [Paenibacillus popilliae ATCC 14706]